MEAPEIAGQKRDFKGSDRVSPKNNFDRNGAGLCDRPYKKGRLRHKNVLSFRRICMEWHANRGVYGGSIPWRVMNMGYVYHGSANGELETIRPRKSTHGKEYVYATKHKSIAFIFLCRWNDFLLTLGTNGARDDPRITLIERYAGAASDIFSNKRGFIYTLDDKDFFALDNGWDYEVVSESEQVPLRIEEISDVRLAIRELESVGEIDIFYYPSRPKDIPDDDSDMIQKAIEIYEMSGDAYNAKYCAERFAHLKDKIKEKFQELYNINIDE